MNELQYYLTKLAEEASEVAQIALKCQQFGGLECQFEGGPDNFQRAHAELNDLLAVVKVLNEKFDFGFEPNKSKITIKEDKMANYLKYSQSLGLVQKP